MKLYSGPLSLFTAKVRIALDEKGLPYDRVEVGWSRENRYLPHHPDVVALNPKAQVPVLVDGELVVYDSTIIFEYLEDRYPRPPLYPADPAERARCRQLEAAADEVLFESLWTLIDQVFYPRDQSGKDVRDQSGKDVGDLSENETDAGEPSESEEVAVARRLVSEYHDQLEKQLSDREWLCGDFSVADIGNFVMLSAAAQFGSPPGPGHTNLLGWFGRMAARPAVQKDTKQMIAFVAGLG